MSAQILNEARHVVQDYCVRCEPGGYIRLVSRNEDEREFVTELERRFVAVTLVVCIRFVPIKQATTMDDNQIDPSYRFSDDILFLIFKLVESSSMNSIQPVERKVPFNISLVSKRWRQLALDMPSLWTKIDLVNVHILPTLIERSKGSSLIIEFLLPQWHLREYSLDWSVTDYPMSLPDAFDRVKYLDQYVEKLLPYIDRWKRFKIEAKSGAVNLEGLFSPAPELQALCLVSSYQGQIRLPVTLFQDHTPQLRVLNLSHVHIPLSSPIYTGLERLELDSITYENEPLSHLVRNIASCPLLKYLRLMSYFAFLPEIKQPPVPVNLAHLRRLLIKLVGPDEIYFLSSFLFPALLKLGLVFSLDDRDCRLTSMDNIVERLPILTRIRSVRVTIERDGRHLTVTGRDGLWHETNIDIFDVLILDSVHLVEILLPAFGEQFPFPALEELYFRGFFHIDNPDPLLFVRTLHNFPTITCLTLYACPSSFLKALFVDPESPSHPCPLLERLVIYYSHSDLIQIIKSRLENPRHVIPLRHLIIIGLHSVDENTLSALRGLSILVEVKYSTNDYWRPKWPIQEHRADLGL